ncbi:MAG: hypothetical protein NZV14_14785 [Bryobacteraceae bacterium]|nr:hypothetical protein [Bryobacteraceae bacterium]MDW8379429.1 hypothetical protein [Bryobacterales bacterium]
MHNSSPAPIPGQKPAIRRRSGEGGFVLMFVFLMAAAAALTIYLELPRVAFESQRLREELLVERGLEYRRAIQLYVRKMRQYPPSIEALESTNGKRFLRRRYVDPMTGKDEWRLIHIGPNGEFTDSVLYQNQKQGQGNQNTFITEGPSIGSGPTQGPGGATVANRLRPSEMAGAPGQAGAEGGSNNPSNPNEAAAAEQQQLQQQMLQQQQQQILALQQQQQTWAGGISAPLPGYPPQANPPQQQVVPQPQTGMSPSLPPPQNLGGQDPSAPPPPSAGFPQQPFVQPGVVPGSVTGFAPPAPPSPGAFPGRITPVQPVQPPQGAFPGYTTQIPSSSQTQGQPAYPQPPGFGPQPGLGQQPGWAQAQALGQQPGLGQPQNANVRDMINRILTTPRAGPGTSTGLGAQTFGAGIAGVASKYEAEGIKLINDRSRYNEWEFLYDAKRDPVLMGGGVNFSGQSVQGTMSPSQSTGLPAGGAMNPGLGTGAGSSPGFGSGFGSGAGSFGTGGSSGRGSGFNTGNPVPGSRRR